MPQTPVSVSAFISSATPSTVYTVPAGKTAIVNNVQATSLLGATVSMTVNKVATDATVYPMTVDRVSGDDVNFWAVAGAQSPNNTKAPINLLKGSLTLGAGESLSIGTSTGAAFKFPQTYTGNGILNQVTHGGGRYVVVGRNDDNSKGLVLTSPDGQNWTRQTFPFSSTLIDVAATTGRIVAISTTYTTGYFTSVDNGVTWTQVAGLSGGHSGAPVSVAFVNSTWIIVGANYIYTSADGATWTLNSALTTYLGGAGVSLKNVTWDGTRYVFSTYYGLIHGNAALTTFTSPGFVRGGVFPTSINWHNASSRFYATLPYNTANNHLVTSTDGVTWSPFTTATLLSVGTPFQIECGSQTSQTLVITSNADYRIGMYSTNSGTSWTQYTNNNMSSPSKRLKSLGNGYFLQFAQNAFTWYSCCIPQTGYYDYYVGLSTTPWSMSQTTTNASYTGSSGDTWLAESASSTNVADGPWVVFGYYRTQADKIVHNYRPNASTGWSNSATNFKVSSYIWYQYGEPVASVFYNNKFWMITQSGYLFSLDNSVGSTLVYVTRVCQGSNGIAVVNGRLCVTNSSSATTSTVFSSTDGTNWLATTTVHAGAYPAGVYSNGIASSGSIGVYLTNAAQISVCTDGESWNAFPVGIVEASSLNGNLFAQSITRASAYNAIGYGTYYITDPTTPAGFTKISTSQAAAETMPNVMLYANNSYFFTSPLAILATPTSTFTSAGVASNAVNGQTFMSANNLYAAATSGSGAVIIDARSTQNPSPVYKLGYVANVNFARSVASVGVSILEIS